MLTQAESSTIIRAERSYHDLAVMYGSEVWSFWSLAPKARGRKRHERAHLTNGRDFMTVTIASDGAVSIDPDYWCQIPEANRDTCRTYLPRHGLAFAV